MIILSVLSVVVVVVVGVVVVVVVVVVVAAMPSQLAFRQTKSTLTTNDSAPDHTAKQKMEIKKLTPMTFAIGYILEPGVACLSVGNIYLASHV